MNALDSVRTTAQELVSFARRQGVDLDALRTDFTFQQGRRWIDVWRKDSLPGTGSADEPIGTLHYSMQGSITVLPRSLKASADSFQGSWTEAGTFESVEQAFELVRAWLIDGKEVDDLPERCTRRYGI